MPEVHSITSADESLSTRTSRRMRRYLISMGIRFACLGLAFVTDGWVRWICVAGAVLLPYVAVMLGNESVEPGQEPEQFTASGAQLPAGLTDGGSGPAGDRGNP